ncbi:hypothetical protein SAMN04487830_10690 [Pseudobutyrivibrio sp. OR37]|uniref:hypothetical protein n=1 Tax=Pseudobutyrivibrio sp. OR37 TaxID=1798186 RepID=UPI0008E58B46|nr:hypothetical protein [Pseudobutyrivibrio sp. OR37]SFH72369.1 hypothetical protein SAMN04487830_10690 [Pseudobutyrivibrio sp. OR37]
MADIGIKNNLHIENSAPAKSAQAPQQTSTPKPKIEAEKPDKKASADILSKEYGPVVSKSKDGDTVRVKHDEDEGNKIHEILQEEIEKLQEQNSHEKPDFETHATVTQIQKNNWDISSEAIDVTSYAGYSDSKLKELYLKGDISQIDYNQEMEARAARRENERIEAQSFNKDFATSISKLSQVERDARTVDEIQNGQQSTTIPDEIRIQALQNFDIV